MRRGILTSISACMIFVGSVPAVAEGGTALPMNPVVVENSKAGSSLWRIGEPYRAADNEHRQIEGYASRTSVLQGNSIDLYVSVNPAQSFTIDIYRVGWYQGAGGRLVRHVGPLAGIRQAPCPQDPQTGLTECHWKSSYRLSVPSSWTSGVYVGLLTNAQGYQRYLSFVVRDDRPAAILFQLPVASWQAYNNWPAEEGGKSLYDTISEGAPTMAGERAVKVSFDRPYAWYDGAADLFKWDAYLIWWLERRGYDVTYSTDIDTHERGANLLQHEAFVSSGHDEYWSKPMYDAVEAARDSGVDLAFFGANDIYWQTRFVRSSSGVRDRVMVCYKDASLDPVKGASATVRWRDLPVDRPEQTLIGVQLKDVPGDVNDPYVVRNSDSWVYANTGLRDGDAIAGLVGYEYDQQMPGPLPDGTSYTLLSESPIEEASTRLNVADSANSVVYQAPSGAWVFGAGTVQWAWGLTKNGVADPRVEQITANVLNRFVGTRVSMPCTTFSLCRSGARLPGSATLAVKLFPAHLTDD